MTEKNIHEAINAVMKEVGYVQKSKSGGLNYSFAGEAALIQALRPAMVEHGIYMHVIGVTDVQREQYATKSGTAMTNTLLTATVRFTHAPTDTHIDVAATGEGSDAGDKSANKAMTGMYKYALRQTFCIETGDDPDKHASEEREVPTGLNGRASLIHRFGVVRKAAKEKGIDVEPYTLNEKMTDGEITELGIELKKKMEAVHV